MIHLIGDNMGILLTVSRILKLYTKDGNLIGEPYKGYLWDKNNLNNINMTMVVRETHGFEIDYVEVYNPEYIELQNYIELQKQRWKSGERW